MKTGYDYKVCLKQFNFVHDIKGFTILITKNA